MKTRTRLRIASLVILLLLISVPYVIGRVTEQRYQRIIASLNAQYGDAAVLERYERGVFSSTAETRIDISSLLRHLAPGLPQEQLDVLTGCVIRTRSSLRHGLLIFPNLAARQPFGPVLATSRDVITVTLPAQIAPRPLTLTSHTTFHLDRRIETAFSIPPGDHLFADALTVISPADITGSLRFDDRFSYVQARLATPQLTLASEGARVALCGLTCVVETLQNVPQPPPAHSALTLSACTFTPPNQRAGFCLSNLLMSSEIVRSNALLHGTQLAALGTLVVADTTYGPITLPSALHNFHAIALQRLQNLMHDAQRNIAAGANPTAVMGLMMASLPELLAQFLQAAPCFEFNDWRAATPHGPFPLRGTIAAEPRTQLSAFSFLNVNHVLRLFTADLHLSLPQSFVEDTLRSETLNWPLDPTTLLHKQNDQYTFHLVFRDGKLLINGAEVDLPFAD
ncbi:MAG: YdgA family protein [bacterium]|nr:YdgA family protein [bacterium]